MASDGTYVSGPYQVFDNGVAHGGYAIDVSLSGGSGTARVVVEGDGTSSMSDPVNLTEHTGQPYYEAGPGETKRVVMTFEHKIIASLPYFRVVCTLDTGGANDADYHIRIRRIG